MIKTLSVSALMIAAAGAASAAPLPAPPMQAFTPAAQTACASDTISVYFPDGTSALTPSARAVLEATQARLEGCIVGQVSLNATADDAKNASHATHLTEARLETVSAALAGYDLDGMRIVANAADTDADTLWTPMDRKVEISFTAWAPEIS